MTPTPDAVAGSDNAHHEAADAYERAVAIEMAIGNARIAALLEGNAALDDWLARWHGTDC